MEELIKNIIRTEVLLESDGLAPMLLAFIGLFGFIFLAFINIIAVDRYEYLHNEQKCFEFKHNMFFIIQHSKNKKIVAKKTFVLEIIGWLLVLIVIVSAIIGLFLKEGIVILIWVIEFIVIAIYGCHTGEMYALIQKKQKL